MIRIVIAEDQGLLRGALASLLRLEDGIDIAGEAADGRTAVSMAEALRPDIVLMDVRIILGRQRYERTCARDPVFRRHAACGR